MILPNPDYHHPRREGRTAESTYGFTDRTCLRLSLATSLATAMRLLRLDQRTSEEDQDLLLNAHQAERQAALLGSPGIQAQATLVLARALLVCGRHRKALETAESLQRLTVDTNAALVAESLVIQARAAAPLGREESPLRRLAIARRFLVNLPEAQRQRLGDELSLITDLAL